MIFIKTLTPFLLSTLLFSTLLNAEKFTNSKQCLECHTKQAQQCKGSKHFKSNMINNPLFEKTVELISDTKKIDKKEVAYGCAKCHNPRILEKKLSKAHNIAKSFGFYNKKDIKNAKSTLNDTKADEGVSCLSCHQVDKIHSEDSFNRGFENVKLVDSDTLVSSSKFQNSPHKTLIRDHFDSNSDALCLSCHKGAENENSVPLYQTGIEYEKSSRNQKCVDCHSWNKRANIIDNIKLNEALEIKIKKGKRKKLTISIKNRTPHKVPTGYGERELEIEIIFKDRRKKVIKSYVRKINSIYTDSTGEVTISYLANKLKSDSRFKPFESRKFNYTLKDRRYRRGTVLVKVWYREAREEIVKMLNLNNPLYSKKYLISKKELKL